MIRNTKKFLCVILVLILIGVVFPSSFVNAENNNSQIGIPVIADNNNYSKYINSFSDYKNSNTDILLFNSDENNGIINVQNDKILQHKVTVSEKSLFNISLSYRITEKNTDTSVGVLIDGSYPFDDASEISLPSMWEDGGEIRSDDFGNEFSPEQKLYDGFVTRPLIDETGVVIYPYVFALSEGEHIIELEFSGNIEIKSIILSAPDDGSISYKDYISAYSRKGEYKGKPVIIEGEDAFIKNRNSIIPMADNSSKKLTPSNVTFSRINYIGSTNWKNSTEEIVWEINVPEDGLYKLGIMYKQDQVINGYSYRHLRIDGYTPFSEAGNIAFPYNTDWKFYEFADKDGNEYLFYLEKGIHELSLSVTLGQTANFYSRLKSYVEKIGDLYIDIIMITGETPDRNRDYELFKQIPDYYEILKELNTGLDTLSNDIEELNGKNGTSYVAAIRNMNRIIKDMIDNSYTAHLYISDYYSSYTTLSSWLYEMTLMPLSIDQIRFAAPNSEFEEKEVGFLESLVFSVQRFLASFTDAYNFVSLSEDDNNTIKIWVNWGRDQTQVLNSLIQESFTPETGINVNLEIVNADLIKGMLSNNQPDLSLHMARATPVNLAMRGALYDLTKFDDYEEVIKRFGDSANIPYEYNGGVYALPDQQSFYIMFYRTDILNELKIEIPRTWDEFMAATAVLQRNNMNSYIPYTKISASTTTDMGIGGLNLFATILMQHGGKFYNNEHNKSLLTDDLSLTAFKYWTDMYTQYKLPTEADFYNRFRVGTCPLGVAVYTQYTTFLQAAPEIQGRWGIALVPGIEDENGNINGKVSGAGTGCAILKKSDKKELAWEFLKWWTNSDTQVRYNANVESILGAVSRTTTANVDAFSRMGWDENDLEVLLEQRKNIEEIPEIPGSYYLSRSVDQAFWNVINGKSSFKDSLTMWGKEADKEIARKVSEYMEDRE